MVGNHRDSWVFGGVDASSGGSVLLELARVVGEKAKSGKICIHVFCTKLVDTKLVLRWPKF